MAVFAQFLSYRCAVTQTCGCHHRTESKNKLDLHLAYLFVDKISTSEPGGWYSWWTDWEPGCWVTPDFGLGHLYHWSKILCASVFLHGDKDTGPWIKSVIREPHYDYNYITGWTVCWQCCCWASSKSMCICKREEETVQEDFSYINWGNGLSVKQPTVFIYCENLNLTFNFPSR